MNADSYDVIIVGAGMAGLNLGSLLARAGRRVLVLEQEDRVGGRAISGRHQNSAVDNGIHVLVWSGYQEEVFRRIDKTFPPNVITWKRSGNIYRDGEWRSFDDILTASAVEVEKIYSDAIYDRSYEEMDDIDDVSMEKFIWDRTRDEGARAWFAYLGWIYAGTRSTPNDVSAGSVFRAWKRQAEADETGRLRRLGYLVKGGSGALAPPLVEAITENRGEVRTGARVSRIVIEGGRARGVEVETGDRVIPTQVRDTEFIGAPVVVSAVPLWDILNIIPEDDLPPWYAARIRFLADKNLSVWSVTYGLDGSTGFDDSGLKWVQAGPVSGRPWVAGFLPYSDTEGQYEVTCWLQSGWWEPPSVFHRHRASVKTMIRRMFDTWEADIREIFPELEANRLWTVRSLGPSTIIETPGYAGRHLISMVPEGVEGLYLVGEKTREAEIMGIYGSAKVALECADRILEL